MIEQEPQENVPSEVFSNESLKINVQHKSGCIIELHVKASPTIVEQAYRQAIKLVGKEVSIPGFRKGKAPESFVLKQYSKAINEQWQKTIADTVFKESEKVIKIPLLSPDTQVHYQLKSHSHENGAEVVFSFETSPSPPPIDPKELSLEPIPIKEIGSQNVEDALVEIQGFFAEWHPIHDRPVQEGDSIFINLELMETDPPQLVYSNTRFHVGPRSMAKWMRDLVEGMKEGESKEGVSVPDEDATSEEKAAFTPKKVRLTLLSIHEPTYPPFDETFAKKLGVSSIEELRQRVEEILKKRAQEEARQKLRDILSQELIKRYPFEIPATLIRKEMQVRFQQLMQDAAFKESWEGMTEQGRKNAIEELRHESDQAVRLFYLCRKVVMDAKIPISPADLSTHPATVLDFLFMGKPPAPFHQQTKEQQALSLSRVMLAKAEDYLIEQTLGGKPLDQSPSGQ